MADELRNAAEAVVQSFEGFRLPYRGIQWVELMRLRAALRASPEPRPESWQLLPAARYAVEQFFGDDKSGMYDAMKALRVAVAASPPTEAPRCNCESVTEMHAGDCETNMVPPPEAPPAETCLCVHAIEGATAESMAEPSPQHDSRCGKFRAPAPSAAPKEEP